MLGLSKRGHLNILYFLLILLVVPLASAEDITISFNKEFDLKRQCINNGTYCSSSAVCNMTIFYPDGNTFLDNELMTNQISFHNVTLPSANINMFGKHPSLMVCTDSGGDISGNGVDPFIIEVTGDGKRNDVFPTQFSFIILGVVFIVISRVKSELSLFGSLGSMLLMVMGVITLYPGYSGFNYSTLPGQALGMSIIGLGFWFLIDKNFSKDEQDEFFTQTVEDDD